MTTKKQMSRGGVSPTSTQIQFKLAPDMRKRFEQMLKKNGFTYQDGRINPRSWCESVLNRVFKIPEEPPVDELTQKLDFLYEMMTEIKAMLETMQVEPARPQLFGGKKAKKQPKEDFDNDVLSNLSAWSSNKS
jgi:hypothetical protein